MKGNSTWKYNGADLIQIRTYFYLVETLHSIEYCLLNVFFHFCNHYNHHNLNKQNYDVNDSVIT